MSSATLTGKRIKQNSFVKPKLSPFSILIFSILLIYAAALFGLIIWSIVQCFMNGPTGSFIENLEYAFNYFHFAVEDSSSIEGIRYIEFGEMLSNSALYALGCAITNTIVPCLTAYVCARYKYKFSKLVYVIVIITMIIPAVGTLPAEISMAQTIFGLNNYGEIWVQWIMKANFLGMYFLIFYDFFSSLPEPFFEAAKIDGSGNIAILFRIVLPMAKKLILTVFILNFVTFWNDYSTPTLYLKEKHPTLAVGLYSIFAYGMPELKAAGAACIAPLAFTVAAPVVALYAIFNKKLLGNLTLGGIK